MARTKNANPALPAHLWTEYSSIPPPLRDLLSQAAHFFDQLGYTSTFNALLTEARENGVTLDVAEWERGLDDGTSATVMALWESWREQEDGFPKLPPTSPVKTPAKKPKMDSVLLPTADEQGSSEDESSDSEEDETEGKQAGLVDDEAESTSDDSSEGKSESDSSDSEGDATVGTKRKREATPDSSSEESSEGESSDEGSDDSSDEEDARPAKRAKTAKSKESSSEGSSNSDDSSDDSSDSESDAAGGVEVDGTSSSGSSSDSSSDSDSSSSDSDSDDSSSDSSSSDSDSSSSDSESSASPPPKKKAKTSTKKQPVPVKDDNDTSSSATLASNSPIKPVKSEDDELLIPTNALDTPSDIHPDRLKRMAPSESTQPQNGYKRMPATEQNVQNLKKENVPFSRIPKDTFVDSKFASNEYVPYDYAERAYKDLSVTKGKGFTKEKNKKKRGAYRGGAIDFTPKGIKFED